MPLDYIEHVLIQVRDLEATCDWYERVLGLTRGDTPDFKFPVQWMYAGERDVLHVTTGGKDVTENRKRYLGQQSEAEQGSGVIDHLAFRGTDLKGMIEHLGRVGVPFRQRMVSDQGLYQLFLIDPNGVKIELNFANQEAIEHGIRPELTASELG